MAKTPKQKTMAENHKVGTVLATGLFLITCLLIAFPLVCGLLGSCLLYTSDAADE